MNNWPKLTPRNGGIKKGEILYIGCGTGGKIMSGSLGEWLRDNTDEVLHCTGVVTDHEIQELKKRIASGTTTADDVVLLDKVLEYAKVRTT